MQDIALEIGAIVAVLLAWPLMIVVYWFFHRSIMVSALKKHEKWKEEKSTLNN